MKRVFIILGLISAALALTLSVTPQFQLAFIPAAAALIFALVAFFIAKNQDHSKKNHSSRFPFELYRLSTDFL
ncbi:hypothetical protein [uncultured Gelidibacter sp.]|uniref:hypothetical protein n=1 Tax=uncultured Gelidibacter sp. TaxID=259318 RepID=UPI00262C9194|nr:hypothetical protein [uncultured Gelidibacter sp.]